jgi:phosphoenolpyruvate synthase/pyruvate phosphate dikinase
MRQWLFNPIEGSKKQPLPSVTEVGGKGRNLYWLAANGFPVPPTWVFGTALFDLVVEQAKLTETIAEIGQTIADLTDDWATAQRALDALEPKRLAVVETLHQVPMNDRVGAALTDLPYEPTQWAVRSSATVEDSRRHSFAGQFLSLLSVPQGKAQWDAVREVWASTFKREVLFYCAQHKSLLPQMAVIFQPMTSITAQDRSGVAFSHSPAPTLPGVLIQATWGTGQIVVEGYGGDLYSVQDTEVQVQPMPPPHIRITGPYDHTVPVPTPLGLALSKEEARELAGLVLAVAEKWQMPVNVEFVWRADKEPTLVQVRSAMQ